MGRRQSFASIAAGRAGRPTRHLRATVVALCILAVWSFLSSGRALAKEKSFEAIGTFTEGDGNCGFPERFGDNFTIVVDGKKIMINQPSTGDSVSGTISSDGEIHLENKEELYKGTADGKKL